MHWLRHTRATQVARGRVNRKGQFVRANDALMRRMFGWTKKSKMPARYTHLTDGDVEDFMDAFTDMDEAEKRKPEPLTMKPRKCLRCGFENPFDAEFCMKDGAPLSMEGAKRIADQDDAVTGFLAVLRDNPKVRRAFLEWYRSLVKNGEGGDR